jgi:predicted RNase H-like nuclease
VREREREQEQELERLEPKVILAEQLALVQEPQASHQQRLGQVEGQVVERALGQVEQVERLVLAVPQTASSWHQHLPELFWLVCQFVRLAEQLPSASLPSLWHVYLQRLEQAQEHQLRYQETHQSYLSL